MSLLIGFFTLVLVVNCLLLILLVLIQLPKKEAGAGLAFGGGASDALFGAGSGTALSNITKYASASFLVLAMFLTILNTKAHRSSLDDINKALREKAASAAPAAPAPAAPALGTPQPLITPSAETSNSLSIAPAATPAPTTAEPAPEAPATPKPE